MKLAILVLALMPLTGDDAPAPEFDILQEYLAQTDTPVVLGQHCSRHGGAPTSAEIPPVDSPTWTNALLHEHAEWHSRHATLGRPSVDPSDANSYGTEFVAIHRAMLEAQEAWRAQRGYPPIPRWDPAGPIPDDLAYPAPPGCRARVSDDPRIPLPTWATLEGGAAGDPLWDHARLCVFEDENRLAKSLSLSYHPAVHERIGGDMADPMVWPRDPAFWAWHAYLDDEVFRRYEDHCARATADAPGAAVLARSTTRPVIADAVAIGGLAIAVAVAAGAGVALRKR